MKQKIYILTHIIITIKIISFNPDNKYNKELNNLPHFLEKLYLPIGYNKVVKGVNSQCVVMIQKNEK